MHNKKLTSLCCICLLLSFGFQFFNQPYNIISTGILTFFFILLLVSRRRPIHKTESAEPFSYQPQTSKIKTLDYQSQKHVSEEVAEAPISALGSQHCQNEWKLIEKEIDQILDNSIKIIRNHIDAHTVAIFFPTSDGGYKLRRYFSQCDCINENAVIYPGVGIIGGFFKDGLQQVNLHEITNDSVTLYYYLNDAGIRSLMASPISADNLERGTIIVDSTSRDFFTNENHAFLNTAAALLGQAVYNTYLYTEHKLEHIRLAAMSNIEKVFFRDLSIDTILNKMVEVIPFAIPCDRLTISIKSENDNSATILRTWGSNCEAFNNFNFPLNDKYLIPLFYSKNICIYRNFSKDHHETRYFEDEPKDTLFNSFLAVPIGVDSCRGILFIESFKRNAFNDSYKDLINRIAISAGLAIEKILIYEKAKELATHDGLTSLYNHREFQQILQDEITRSIRYKDPLSLVICDIDYFKKVNDTWGHQFGDSVLKGVASYLDSSIRNNIDTASRYGGEEFALILVKTDKNAAIETVERIRQGISKMEFKSPSGEQVHVSMSFGIAVYGLHAKRIDELIKKADKALYRAKENGRNRVEVF